MDDAKLPPTVDRYIRKKAICDELGVDGSTVHAWVRAGIFPAPRVLNEGMAREIIAWPESEYLAWKASRPQRIARPIADAAYAEPAIAKRKQTRAARRAGKRGDDSGSVPERAATSPVEPGVVATPVVRRRRAS